MSLLRIFRADPLLAGLTTLLSAAICLPLFVTPFLPMQDLPDHVKWAKSSGSGVVAQYALTQYSW